MVCDVHLFVLQIHTSSFETSWQGERVGHWEDFHRLGLQDVTELDSD
jgi:hypothetical protein